MMQKWMLSQCFVKSDGVTEPVCTAYGMRFLMPTAPAAPGGWCLVFMLTSPQQMDAAGKDPRVQVYRSSFATITPETVTTYAEQGATAGMSLGELLDALSGVEPNFGTTSLLNAG